LTAFPFRSFF